MPRDFIVFDAYGTLFDVHSAAARSAASLGQRWERLSEIWRTKQLEYTWVRAACGHRQSFWYITEASLDFAAAATGGITASERAALLDAYRTLDAYPEAAATLQALKTRGATLAILSNGDPAMLDEAVASAGLGGLFNAVLSVEAAATFKPMASVYRLVTDHYGVAPAAVAFVSSNRWDIAGGKSFGFFCNWVNRAGRPDEYADLPPDRVIASLTDLIAD
ncbi:MAG: haloacid dehalogenase type II [Hyphomicrobiaceae bacterium]|nr:haloacid dehalogenase type II [Hyphomicrobiaceae bacterium]